MLLYTTLLGMPVFSFLIYCMIRRFSFICLYSQNAASLGLEVAFCGIWSGVKSWWTEAEFSSSPVAFMYCLESTWGGALGKAVETVSTRSTNKRLDCIVSLFFPSTLTRKERCVCLIMSHSTVACSRSPSFWKKARRNFHAARKCTHTRSTNLSSCSCGSSTGKGHFDVRGVMIVFGRERLPELRILDTSWSE